MSDSDALAAAQKRISETAASLAESAARLRAEIAAGRVPPKAAGALAAQLEEIVARMTDRQVPPEPEPDVSGIEEPPG